MHILIFERELRVNAGFEERAESERSVFEQRHFGKTVAVEVVSFAQTVLSVYHDARIAVVIDYRGIESRVVFEGARSVDGREGVAEFARVADRLAGDDVNGSADGIGAEESRSAAAHHFDAFDHVGRDLFEVVNAGKGADNGARIDQNLRVGAVEAVNAHLRGSAVLAIILDAQSRLEFQSFRKRFRVGHIERFHVEDADQRRRQAAGRFIAVGRYHHRIERYILFIEFKIDFLRGARFYFHLSGSGFEAHHRDFEGERAFGQVFQKIMSGGIGGGAYGGAF